MTFIMISIVVCWTYLLVREKWHIVISTLLFTMLITHHFVLFPVPISGTSFEYFWFMLALFIEQICLIEMSTKKSNEMNDFYYLSVDILLFSAFAPYKTSTFIYWLYIFFTWNASPLMRKLKSLICYNICYLLLKS